MYKTLLINLLTVTVTWDQELDGINAKNYFTNDKTKALWGRHKILMHVIINLEERRPIIGKTV